MAAGKGLALIVLLLPLVALGCGSASPDAKSGPVVKAERAANQPQRTLVVAVRGEPPSIASRPVVQFSGSLKRPRELFNAVLDFRDEREIPRALLAEALPQLNTETWRLLPDGRMETR